MSVITPIDLGLVPNDGNGDPLRGGGGIINTNFENLNTDKLERAGYGGTAQDLEDAITAINGDYVSLTLNQTVGGDKDWTGSNNFLRLLLQGRQVSSYRGKWNASTNVPTLENTDTNAMGFFYECTVGGTIDFGSGDIDFLPGDYVKFFYDTGWGKWINNNQDGAGGDMLKTVYDPDLIEGDAFLFDNFKQPTNAYTVVEDDDQFNVWDDLGGIFKRISWLNYKANIKTYADTLYSGKADAMCFFLETPEDKTYTLALEMPYAGTIPSTVTESLSGTCTATFKINGVALGGTANAVSATKQSQAHASDNAFIEGDTVEVTISANANCLDMALTVKIIR